MADLSPTARALIDAGRGALRPAAHDRARVLAAVRARLDNGGNGAPHGDGGAPSAVGSGAGWQALGAALVGLALATGGLVYALRGDGASSPAARTSATPAALVAEPSPSLAKTEPSPIPQNEPDPAVPAPVAVDALPTTMRAGLTRRPSDRLAQEVALMSRAETELHRGHFASALRLLDQHRREFPNGTLSQERLAARVQALCALGRPKEAEAALGRLTRLSPDSPHEDRARAACVAKN